MNLLLDLRYGIRLLWKDRRFAGTVILMVAIAIGANIAIFSFANALFWKPIDAPNSNRLVRILIKNKQAAVEGAFSYPEYLSLRRNASTFDTLVAEYPTAPLNVVADDNSREQNGAVVSANYFSLLGVKPLRGRFFLPEEDAVPDRNPVAVISARLLHTRFADEPSTLGREITINGATFRVIGVAPEGFYGDEPGRATDVWIPTAMLRVGYRWCDAYAQVDCTPLHLLGRLAPGQSVAVADGEINSISAAEHFPVIANDRQLAVVHATGQTPGRVDEVTPQVHLLMVIAGTLLLIACANLAGLSLARGVARRRELAVRLALGARPRRIVRQLLTENLLLAGIGAASGLLLAMWLRPALVSFYTLEPEGGRGFYNLSLDWRVALFCAGATILTGFLFGLAPAIASVRAPGILDLRVNTGIASSHRSRIPDFLVAGQVALSLVLVVLATLMARSTQNILAGSNFDAARVVILRLRPRLMKYSPADATAFYRKVTERLRTLPEVQSVGYASGGVGLVWTGTAGFSMHLGRADEQTGTVSVLPISSGFFDTLRIPLLQGRSFNNGDQSNSARVVVVNEAAARQYWPRESAVDKFLTLDSVTYRVIGVVADVGLRRSGESPVAHIYSEFWQSGPGSQGDMRMVVRVTGATGAALAAIHHSITSIDPQVPIDEDMPLSEQIKADYATLWLARSVAWWCGLTALLLSAVGLYSLLAFAVRSRTRDIGVRMALGALPAQVAREVLGHGMRLCVAGIVTGLVVAAAGARLIASLLSGVPAFDIATFAAGVAAVITVALTASYLPARQAARVDAMRALRQE